MIIDKLSLNSHKNLKGRETWTVRAREQSRDVTLLFPPSEGPHWYSWYSHSLFPGLNTTPFLYT